jgi:8-hydroxy-5-deazaflavin:NADPH oxidoreductase
MNIGILGSGNVGGTLGTRWAERGHRVVFSSRNPNSEEMKQLLARAGSNARAATVPEAAATSEILLFATPWPAAQQAVQQAGNQQTKF